MVLLFRGRGCCVFGFWRLLRYLTLNPAPNLRCPCCQLRRAFREEPPKTFGDSLPCSRALSIAGVHGWPLPASAPNYDLASINAYPRAAVSRHQVLEGPFTRICRSCCRGRYRTPCGTPPSLPRAWRSGHMRLRSVSLRNQRQRECLVRVGLVIVADASDLHVAPHDGVVAVSCPERRARLGHGLEDQPAPPSVTGSHQRAQKRRDDVIGQGLETIPFRHDPTRGLQSLARRTRPRLKASSCLAL